MISKELLRQVIYDQRNVALDLGVARDINTKLIDCDEILVITGVRRCGKSVLLRQIQHSQQEKDYYINFDDERLINFKADDFQLLCEVFAEDFGEQHTFYLDEIQNITGWERFASRLYNSKNKVFITGSNANLLSRELGTYLTGRYVGMELYPFSFAEYLSFNEITLGKNDMYTTQGKSMLLARLKKYLKDGGFPQYIKTENVDYLKALYNDIIYRDVATRYNISNDQQLREMLYYLASNATHRFTYKSVANAIGLKSSETVNNYINYLENTYLLGQLNKYDYKAGVQIRSPKKIYFIDNAIIRKIGFSVSENLGELLENIIYIQLKRLGNDVFYYNENGECDFVVRQGAAITDAIQVTLDMSDEKTRTREINGVVEAMDKFNLNSGTIITLDYSEEITLSSNRKISIVPAWKWLLIGLS